MTRTQTVPTSQTAGGTVTLTVTQALVKFLSVQYSERDGLEQRLIAGTWGIFGHGNVAGLGQALLQAEIDEPGALPYVLGRNEQAMVHSAVAFARMRNRMQTYAVSSSVGPGATNMVTGAALATINRIPVLLLPADTFADRAASPLLQELELPYAGDVTVNDAAGADPNATAVVPVKPVPMMLNVVPPAFGPEVTDNDVTAGGAAV